MNSENPIFGAISAKFRTFDMAINFCDSSKFGFPRPVGGMLFLLIKFPNILAIKLLENIQHFWTVLVIFHESMLYLRLFHQSFAFSSIRLSPRSAVFEYTRTGMSPAICLNFLYRCVLKIDFSVL